MISNENLGGLMGAPVVGADGDRIGTVGQVFVDPVTGKPIWVTVHTGWFGRHETFVPLDEANWNREVLQVPYDKGLVKDAPRIDTDEALSADAEGELYGYYGLGGGESDAGESLRLRKYQATEENQAAPEETAQADAASAPGQENDGPKHRA